MFGSLLRKLLVAPVMLVLTLDANMYGVCKACLGDALEMVRKDVAQRRAFGKQEAEQDSVPAAELAEGSSYDVLL